MSSPPVEALVASVPQSLSNVRAASELAARLTKAVQRERPAVALVRAAQSATARLLAFVARHQTNDDTAVDYSRRAGEPPRQRKRGRRCAQGAAAPPI